MRCHGVHVLDVLNSVILLAENHTLRKMQSYQHIIRLLYGRYFNNVLG